MQSADFKNRKKITWLVSALVDEDKRDILLQKLKENKIDARPFFIPLSEMEIYRKYAKNCIVSKQISKKGLNLPTTYEIDAEKIERMAQIVMSTLHKGEM